MLFFKCMPLICRAIPSLICPACYLQGNKKTSAPYRKIISCKGRRFDSAVPPCLAKNGSAHLDTLTCPSPITVAAVRTYSTFQRGNSRGNFSYPHHRSASSLDASSLSGNTNSLLSSVLVFFVFLIVIIALPARNCQAIFYRSGQIDFLHTEPKCLVV